MENWIPANWEILANKLLSLSDQLTLAQQVHVVIFAIALIFIISNVSKPKIIAITAVIISYFIWRVNHTILPFVHESSIIAVLMWCYLVAEIISIMDIVQNDAFELIKTRRKRRLSWATMAPNWEHPSVSTAPTARVPQVDILIPTYNEDGELLRKTILRALEVVYDNKTVNVLDDGDRAWLRDLCQELGARYFRRDDNEGAKAGNMNAALPFLTGEFVAILDADFLALDNFLVSAMPAFADPKVGCVQFPQVFYNPDASQINSKTYGKIEDEQWFWYSEVLPYRDSLDLATSCGSCSVVRRSALNEIGGTFPADTITEDFDMSLRFLEKGYITRYLFEGVAVGLAADSTQGFFAQRVRWALGNIKAWRLSLKRRGRLSFASRVLLVEWRVISLPARMITLLAPAFVFLFNVWPLKVSSVLEYLVYVAPFILVISEKEIRTARAGVASIFVKMARDAGVAIVLGSMILAKLLSQGRPVFKVTPKTRDKAATSVAFAILIAINAFLTLALANAAFRYALGANWSDYHLVSALWLIWNLTLTLTAAVMFFDRAPLRKKDRLVPADPMECWLEGLPGQSTIKGQVTDLSEGGARIALPFCLQEVESLVLVLADLRLKARVLDVGNMVQGHACQTRLRFKGHSQNESDDLVRLLYSGRFIPEVLKNTSVRKKLWRPSDGQVRQSPATDDQASADLSRPQPGALQRPGRDAFPKRSGVGRALKPLRPARLDIDGGA